MENYMYSNVNGATDPILNSTTVATTGTAKAPSSWTFENIFGKVAQLGNMGLEYQRTEAEKVKADAEKAKAIAAGKISENKSTDATIAPVEKSNTTLYVVLGVVLLASVGGYVYLKNRNKV